MSVMQLQKAEVEAGGHVGGGITGGIPVRLKQYAGEKLLKKFCLFDLTADELSVMNCK